MKRFVLTLSLLGCFAFGNAQDITVDFEGRVTHETAPVAEVIVQVLQNGKLMTTFKTDNSGAYNVYLPLGHDYIISISKNDYVQKYFTVSTKDIPDEQASIKFPSITADMDLFKFHEGVDYSLFDEPINKFYYNKKKGNFEYDKDLLKEKKEAMKRIKQAEKEAIQLALKKNKAKQEALAKVPNKKEEAKLAQEKKALDEKLAKQQSLMEKLIEEEKPLFAKNDDNKVELNIVAADKNASEKIIDKKVNDLIAKHKQSVSEEQQKGQGVIVIKRVVVREQDTWVYEKKIFDWGGVAYFRDKQRITASTFNQETASK